MCVHGGWSWARPVDAAVAQGGFAAIEARPRPWTHVCAHAETASTVDDSLAEAGSAMDEAMVEAASIMDEALAKAESTVDGAVAEAASTADVVVAEAASTMEEASAKAASTADEAVAEAASTANVVVAEAASTMDEATCMGTGEDIHKVKTSFSLDETSNNKSKFSNFCQKTSNFLVISEYVLLCVTETVTLVLERQLVSQNLRHASEGDIPRSYVFWIGQNGAQGAETLWVCFQKACPPLQCHMPIGFLF